MASYTVGNNSTSTAAQSSSLGVGQSISLSVTATHDGVFSSVSAEVGSNVTGVIWTLGVQGVSVVTTGATPSGPSTITTGASGILNANQVYNLILTNTNAAIGDSNVVYGASAGAWDIWLTETSAAPATASAPTFTTTQFPLSVIVSWTLDESGGKIGATQQLQSAPSSTGPWTLVGTFGHGAGTSTDAFSTQLTGLTASTTYWFRVLVSNSEGGPTTSAAASVTTPAGFAMTSLLTAGSPIQNTLNWVSISGATAYEVDRGILSGGSISWSTVATGVTATSYVDSASLSPGTAYYYRVIATATGGPFTSPTAAIYTIGPAAPAAPLLALDPYSFAVDIWWPAIISVNPATASVQCSTDGGSTWTAQVSGIAGTFWQDASPFVGTAQYRIVATDVSTTNPSGSTSTGAAASITLSIGAPAAPTLTLQASPLGVIITRPSVSGATGYTWQKSSNGMATWSAILSNSTAASFTDTAVSAWQQPAYRIVALKTAASQTGAAARMLVTDGTTPAGLRWVLNGADVGANVRHQGSRVTKRVSRQGNQAVLSLWNTIALSDAYEPVAVLYGAQLLFQGWVLDVRQETTGTPTVQTATLTPQDAFALFNACQVTDCYEQQSAGFILQQLIAKHMPGLTTTNVQGGPTVAFIAFGRETLDQCIVRLLALAAAQNAEANVYVDAQFDVHLEFAGAIPAAPTLFSDANPQTLLYP